MQNKNFGIPVSISSDQVVFLSGHDAGNATIRICKVTDTTLIELSEFQVNLGGAQVNFSGAKFNRFDYEKHSTTNSSNFFTCYSTQSVSTRVDGVHKKEYVNQLHYFIHAIDLENRTVKLLRKSRENENFARDSALELLTLPNGDLIGFHSAVSSRFGKGTDRWITHYKPRGILREGTHCPDVYEECSFGFDDSNVSTTYIKLPTSLANKRIAWVNTWVTEYTRHGLQIWNLESHTFEKMLPVNNLDRITDLQGLTAEKLAISTRDDFQCTVIEIWDVEKSICIKKIDFGNKCALRFITVSKDNHLIAVTESSDKREISTWNGDTFDVLNKTEISKKFIIQGFFPDGRLLCLNENQETVICGSAYLSQIPSLSPKNSTQTQIMTLPQLPTIAGWKKDFDEANLNYAKGKGAFYTKNFSNAITFFQLAKDLYKNVITDSSIGLSVKQKAQNRISKIKDPGKYSISKCK